MTRRYVGSCHCGAVRFSFEGDEITKGLRCTCSICSRKGALMYPGFIPEDALEVNAENGSVGLYQFGPKTAKHYFCRNCGIYTHHESARKPGHYRVNLGCVAGIDTFALETEVFDGKHLL